MQVTIYESDVLVCGVYIELEAECTVHYEDDSFSHAFGVEKCGHWEIDEIFGLQPSDCVRTAVLDEFRARGYTNHNRRFKKRVRQLEHAIEATLDKLDPNEVFSEGAKDSAVEKAADTEPDYPEPEERD